MTMSAIKNVEFYVVDFDRTLVDSDKLLEVFIEIADAYFRIPKEKIKKVDADIKQRGDTFFLAGYIRDHLSSENRLEEWEDLEKKFILESQSLNYLLPDAAELLEWLAAHGKRFGILTYGDPLWQGMKLSAAGFSHTHHIIMEQKEKSIFINSWQKSDGSFRIPDELGRGTANEIIMIDDKAVSFAEFPPAPSKGYWVLDPSHELLSQKGTVPENVTRFNNMQSVIRALQ